MKAKIIVRSAVSLYIFLASALGATAQNWTTLEGGMNSDYAEALERGNLNSLYTLGNYGDAFDTNAIIGIAVAKYDTTGTLIWVWHPDYPTTGLANGSDLVLDNSENIYLTGYLTDTVQIGDSVFMNSPNGYMEFFVAKLDSAKNEIWAVRAKSMDSTTFGLVSSTGMSIELSNQNKIYLRLEVGGPITIGADTIEVYSFSRFIIKMDTSGAIEWIRDCNCEFFEVDTSGNYYTASSSTLKKFDDAANLIWQITYSAPIDQIDLDENNLMHLVIDSTLHKINLSNGMDIWTTPIIIDLYPIISTDDAGNVLLAGKAFPATPPPWSTGSYFAEFDSSGYFIDDFYWGNPLASHNSVPEDVILRENGGVFVFGGLSVTSTFPLTSTFVFGFDTLPNIANFDTYLSKIDAAYLITGTPHAAQSYTSEQRIYPNPTDDKLVIEQFNPSQIETEIVLFDLFGRPLLIVTTIDQIAELDLSPFDSGVYLVRISNSTGSYSTRVTKE